MANIGTQTTNLDTGQPATDTRAWTFPTSAVYPWPRGGANTDETADPPEPGGAEVVQGGGISIYA